MERMSRSAARTATATRRARGWRGDSSTRHRPGRGTWPMAVPVAVAASLGVAAVAVGITVVGRARLDRSFSEVVELAGTTHTARLGVIEVCIGAIMILAAATRSRLVLGAMAAALAVVGAFMLLDRRRVAAELAIGTVDASLVLTAAAVLAISVARSEPDRP